MPSAVKYKEFEDQSWRLNNLYWIRTKEGQRVKFQMNWGQEQLWNDIWYNNIILKGRQIGMSTFINLLMLDNCIFNKDYAGIVIAHDLDSAIDLFERNIKTPFESLPPPLLQALSPKSDQARMIRFNNGSSIRVATSGRSGTYQMLHVSEFGKICAKYPDKAIEIVTGSLETVGQGNLIFIESTAEGREGFFYQYCQQAIASANKPKLSRQEYRFHFFPWYKHPEYASDPELILISKETEDYFASLRDKSIELNAYQKAWYAQKRRSLGDAIWREYPSTPEEAFQASMEGTYYAAQIAQARREGRIRKVPIEPSAPINTFWDLGVDDFTAIWLHQRVGLEDRFIDYIECTGESLQYYVNKLWRYRDLGYIFGSHYMPHDAKSRSLRDGKNIEDKALELGLRPLVIVRTPDLLAGIQSVRDRLGTSWFDEVKCAKGIDRLENYRKEWSEKLAGYTDRPRHDDNSHGADAYRIFAQGFVDPLRMASNESDIPVVPDF